MTTSPFVQAAAAPPTSWWSRNWKWFLPLGIVTGIAVLLGVIVALVAGIFGLLRSSDAYQLALERAQASPAVQAALGVPITDGLVVLGEVKLQNSSGHAKLTIPIAGPNGEAKINLRATKAEGRWTYSQLEVVVTGTKQRIDLLGEAPPGPGPERASD